MCNPLWNGNNRRAHPTKLNRRLIALERLEEVAAIVGQSRHFGSSRVITENRPRRDSRNRLLNKPRTTTRASTVNSYFHLLGVAWRHEWFSCY
jgi:hypothetical protein